MAKTKVDEWDTVPANNADIDGISILGTAPASNMDNALRELMAQIRATPLREAAADMRVALGVIEVADAATLIADATFTYTAGQAGTVAAGQFIHTRAEGFIYEVAASGATDNHTATAGSVKLYAVPQNGAITPQAFGCIDGGAACDAAFWQSAEAALALGCWLDGGSGEFTLASTASKTTYTGDLKWRNIKLYDTTAGDGDKITITGPLFDNRQLLTASVAGGALAGTAVLPIANTTGYTAGDIVLVMSDLLGDAEAKTSEWAIVKSVQAGVSLTLTTKLKCSYATANSARVLRCPFTLHIWFDDVKIRSAAGDNRTHFSIDRAVIHKLHFSSINSGDCAMQSRCCMAAADFDANFASEGSYYDSGSRGYGFNPAGWFGNGGVVGKTYMKRGRHAIVNGSSGSATMSATAGDNYIATRNLYYGNTMAEDMLAAPCDGHPGYWHGGFGDGVAFMATDALAGEDATAFQGAHITCGNWEVHGAVPRTILLIQPSGCPDIDYPVNTYDIRSFKAQASGTDGFMLYVESIGGTPKNVSIRVGVLAGQAAGGIYIGTTDFEVDWTVEDANYTRKERDGIKCTGAHASRGYVRKHKLRTASGSSAAYGVYPASSVHEVTIADNDTDMPAGSYHIRAQGPVLITEKLTRTGGAGDNYSPSTSLMISEACLRGSTIWDIPSTASGATASTTITVPGAVFGDHVSAVLTYVNRGTLFSLQNAEISAADTVTITYKNNSAGAIDPSSGRFIVEVRKIY